LQKEEAFRRHSQKEGPGWGLKTPRQEGRRLSSGGAVGRGKRKGSCRGGRNLTFGGGEKIFPEKKGCSFGRGGEKSLLRKKRVGNDIYPSAKGGADLGFRGKGGVL